MFSVPAPGSCTHWLFSQISGVVTTLDAESRPAMVSTRPSGRMVLVGYHRPNAILGATDQVWLVGSKMLVASMPVSSALCPPDTSRRPSARNVCPEQNSMVSAWMALNWPEAGSHRRGIEPWVPATPPSSYLPHPSTLPVGSRWMWRGTMGQGTSGPHLPVVASEGNAVTFTGAAVTLALPVPKASVVLPAPLMPRSPNLARPCASVVAVAVPSRVPGPADTLAVTTTPAAAFPPASFT